MCVRVGTAQQERALYCRGPGLDFQNPHGGSHHLQLQFQGIQFHDEFTFM